MWIKFLLLLLTAMSGGNGAPAAAQGPQGVTADQVKAAFLYNFGSFVVWPAQSAAQKSITIGVMGDDEVESELRKNIDARAARSREVSVRRINSMGDVDGVHVLYIGPRHNARLASLIAGLKNRPILVVTDADDGLDHGSMINFITGDRVQFEISIPAAMRAGLQLNSRLLSVATRIRKGQTDLDGAVLHAAAGWRHSVSAGVLAGPAGARA
jgi:hypothetical protein